MKGFNLDHIQNENPDLTLEQLNIYLKTLIEIGHVDYSVDEDGEFLFWLTPSGLEFATKEKKNLKKRK